MRNHKINLASHDLGFRGLQLGALAIFLGLFLVGPATAADVASEAAEAAAALADPATPMVGPESSIPLAPGADPLAQPASYHERPEGEWRGMLVDLNVQQVCRKASQCGNALACVGGVCSPCSSDDQCGKGAACVLDHCVLEHQVSCRSRSDCSTDAGENATDDALCILSGYSHDVRGNGDMQAYCQEPWGGEAPAHVDFERAQLLLDAQAVKDPGPIDPDDLLADVEEYLLERDTNGGPAPFENVTR